MAFLHDEGELLVLDGAFNGRDVEVGLFNNSTDSIAESDSYSAINTEPGGTDYSTKTVSSPSVTQNSGTTEVSMGDLSFTVSDATTSINYVYVRDTTSGDLIFTNALDQSYNLDPIDTLNLSNVGMKLD